MIKLFNEDFLKVDSSLIPPINLTITSPPYSVGILYDEHNDEMKYEDYLKWCFQWIKKVYDVSAKDGRFCLNIPFTINPDHLNQNKKEEKISLPVVADLTKICQQVGFKYYRTIIWCKNRSDKTCWGSWRSASAPFIIDPSESILIFYKSQWKRKTDGVSTISKKEFMSSIKNVWEMQPETHSKHPAAFPIELPQRCINLLSYKDDIIMDNFLGSGTSGEAAVRSGRSFIGIEKSKEYFKMASDRIYAAELQTSLIKEVVPINENDTEESW